MAAAADPLLQSVKLAMLVRLAALTVGLGGMVGQRLTGATFVAILLLCASSAAGLLRPQFLEQLTRHPLLAMADVLLVVAVFVVLGVDSPLVLAALSTAFLIGLVYPLPVAALLGPVLAITYAGASELAYPGPARPPFLLVAGLPATLLCLVWIGHSVARMYHAQQAAESRLAALAQASAAQDERNRLAREMHDSLAKSLQGIAFGAASLPAWVDRDGERARQTARDLAQNATEAVEQARTLLTRMRTDQPLRPFHEVLGDVLAAWGRSTGHPVHPSLEPVDGLSPDTRYELLGALREALENVRRHAPGAPVRVVLRPVGADLAELSVTDRGPGFDPATIGSREEQGHFGVRGMSERLAAVGGRTRLESAPGVGTVVAFTAPTG